MNRKTNDFRNAMLAELGGQRLASPCRDFSIKHSQLA
jgi:hypothetical protein